MRFAHHRARVSPTALARSEQDEARRRAAEAYFEYAADGIEERNEVMRSSSPTPR
jgi:hypothetical protein